MNSAVCVCVCMAFLLIDYRLGFDSRIVQARLYVYIYSIQTRVERVYSEDLIMVISVGEL